MDGVAFKAPKPTPTAGAAARPAAASPLPAAAVSPTARPIDAWVSAFLDAAPAPATGSDAVRLDPSLAERLTQLRGALPAVPCARPSAAPKSDVVVYTAHPDDEAMYGGGTLAKLVRSGRRVDVVVLSHGENGRVVERDADGRLIERRDLSPSELARLRDAEAGRAVGGIGAALDFLFGADDQVDFGWTTSPMETLAHWDQTLEGGVAELTARLVADLRTRRPRVVMTLDTRNDPQSSGHGHHKATGFLVDLACRFAADPSIPGGEPHVVEELVTFAPEGMAPDLMIEVDPKDRLAMLREYRTQFDSEDLTGLAARGVDHFMVQWQAAGSGKAAGSSVLEELTRPADRSLGA